MKYRKLGRSGLKVSEIGLGSWLTYGTATEAETAGECIRLAYESGINFFDTANAYNNGAAEQVMGTALKAFPRSSYVLATKVYFPMGKDVNERGLSRKHIREQCDASLKRLGVDYIDLYQCHRFDADTPVEETLRALDDLVSAGKILYAGVSEWTGGQLAEAADVSRKLALHPLISNQPIYNMIERYIEEEVLPVSEREGIGQVVFSPLAQGVLTGKYKPGQGVPEGTRAADSRTNNVINSYLQDDVLTCVGKLNDLAAELGMTLSQFALAWVLRQPGVSSAIIGSSRPAQIAENIKAVDMALSEDSLRQAAAILEEIKDFRPAR